MQEGERNATDSDRMGRGSDEGAPGHAVVHVKEDDLSSLGIHLGSTMRTSSELTPVIPMPVGSGRAATPAGDATQRAGGGSGGGTASKPGPASGAAGPGIDTGTGTNGVSVGEAAAAAAKATVIVGLPHFEATARARDAAHLASAAPGGGAPPGASTCSGGVRHGGTGWA
jgi:hypothetical protein